MMMEGNGSWFDFSVLEDNAVVILDPSPGLPLLYSFHKFSLPIHASGTKKERVFWQGRQNVN